MRILVFGASITQGFWDTEGGWVQRIRTHYDTLRLQDFAIDQPTIFNLGISGDGTADVLKRFVNETKARHHQELVFVFAIGTNNAVQEAGEFRSTPERYREELEGLINQACQFSSKILLVGLPPCDERRTTPVSWGDFIYTNERIWLMEEVMRSVAAKHSLPHVPVFEVFQKEQSKHDLFADGLHPNNAGHELIANLVLPYLEVTIKQAL